MSAEPPVSQAEQTRAIDGFSSPQSRLSPRTPEAAGPMIETGDGWAPAPAGPVAHVIPPLSAAEVAAQSSPAAIEARERDLDQRMHDAAKRTRAGLR